ncbi:MAG: hypothetical protein IJT95_07220 [Abditibacteriota bacterium]|nr:hypothetical protein [Abditibacteriota bacterium]
MSTIICRSCGRELPEGTTLCYGCGCDPADAPAAAAAEREAKTLQRRLGIDIKRGARAHKLLLLLSAVSGDGPFLSEALRECGERLRTLRQQKADEEQRLKRSKEERERQQRIAREKEEREKADREKRENRSFVIRIVLIALGSLVLLSVSFVVSFLQWIPAIIGLLAIIMIFAGGEYRGIGCLVFILFGVLISILEALGFKVL